MKTKIFTYTFAAAIAIGFALPAVAANHAGRAAAANSVSEKPEVTIAFHHTAENPYDIRILSWLDGMASRVQVVPTTQKTIIVAFNTGDLHGAKITGRDPSRIGFVICKNGKPTLLFDMLCLEKRKILLPNLITRVSDKTEWRMAIALQGRGLLDTKNFARAPLSRDQYAFSPLPIVAVP